ncbi:hypothetical protein [Actinoalloteichus spitiensis]|uniref:hypothetical protein n=1 Tax=Actinoalloteichus spitiensis TaxID=252394 RepID=UPI000371D392|nr:hypothetical protein [Actinoalloteichus spitiensis]
MPHAHRLTSAQLTSLVIFQHSPPSEVFADLRWSFTSPVRAHHLERAVRMLTARHTALRGTVVPGQDGHLHHVIAPPDTTPTIHHHGPLDPADLDALVEEHRTAPFDHARHWPARWLLVATAEGDIVLICLLHHVAAGRRGRAVISEELTTAVEALTAGRPLPPAWPPAIGPDRLRAAEDGERGRLADQRHRRHVRELLLTLPNTPFTADFSSRVPPGSQRRGLRGDLDSPELLGHLDGHSRRWGIPASAIVLAAVTSASGFLLPQDSATLWRLLTDHGGPSEPHGSVVCYQPTTSLVPGWGLPDDLREAAATLWHRTLVALRNGGHGDQGVVEESHRVSRERGVSIVPTINYNFVEGRPADRVGLPAPVAGISVEDSEHHAVEYLAVTVWRLRETLRITLLAHVGLTAEGGPLVHRFLDHVARTLRSGRAPSPVPRPAAAPHLIPLSHHRWVNPQVVQAGLVALDLVHRATVRVAGAGPTATLIAEVTTPPATTEADLRAAATSQLDLPGFAVPDRFHIHWDTTAPHHPRPPSPERDALVEILRAYLPPGPVDGTSSYLAAGGTFTSVPAILHRATLAGWTGLTWQDLCSHRPIAELGGALRRSGS